MFDAKSILDSIVRSAAPSTAPGQPQSGGGGGLGDILGNLARQVGQSNSGAGGADLSGMLASIKDKLNQAGGSISDSNSIADVLSKALSQATQGVKEGGARVGEATGATDAMGKLASNPEAQDALKQLKDFVQKNPMAVGAAAGGLGALVLGTHLGRSVATGAAKVGALAMISGLAYTAVQNYQAGKPLITGAAPTAAPTGSGYEPAAVSNDAAIHFIQAMIAAANADGRIDPAEHDKIVGSLKQAGVDSDAEAFLAKEFNSPKSVQDLAKSVSSPQEGIQLYTAARIAIAHNSPAEAQFLQSLATALGIDPKLAAEIDATAKSAA